MFAHAPVSLISIMHVKTGLENAPFLCCVKPKELENASSTAMTVTNMFSLT